MSLVATAVLLLAFLLYYWTFVASPLKILRYKIDVFSSVIVASLTRMDKNRQQLNDRSEDEPTDVG
tara:strand:- start:14 stop:211 length:198 start_codon:yes stop_codon:yes gene_type:complete